MRSKPTKRTFSVARDLRTDDGRYACPVCGSNQLEVSCELSGEVPVKPTVAPDGKYVDVVDVPDDLDLRTVLHNYLSRSYRAVCGACHAQWSTEPRPWQRPILVVRDDVLLEV